jgi:hypothetical protein
VDGGVVDQDVHPALGVRDVLGEGGETVRVGDVEPDGTHATGQLPGHPLARGEVAGAEQHDVPARGALADHLTAQPAVAARHHDHPMSVHGR